MAADEAKAAKTAEKRSLVEIMLSQQKEAFEGLVLEGKLEKILPGTRKITEIDPATGEEKTVRVPAPDRVFIIFKTPELDQTLNRVAFINTFPGSKVPLLPMGGVDARVTFVRNDYVASNGEVVESAQVSAVEYNIDQLPKAAQAALAGMTALTL